MNQKTILLCLLLPIIMCSSFITHAGNITSMSNTLLTSSFTPTQTMPIFRSRPNVVRVRGPWLDTTNDIDAVGLDGQPNFNIGVGNKSGANNDPYVEFTLNSDRPGRYTVILKRPGGEDRITIIYTNHIAIASTQVLTMGNATPAYLDAFPINQDTRLRITGTNVNLLSFRPSDVNYSAISTISATAAQSDFKFRYSTRRDKIDIKQIDFVFTVAGRQFKYLEYKGVSIWVVDNFPFFRAYDKPDLTVDNQVIGIYNRKQGSCGAINQNNNFMIQNPSRCVTEFNLANPIPETPQVEKIVTMPDVRFTITNNSYAPVFTPITVHVKFGLNILETLTIPRMIAKEQKVIVFHRPESRKKLVRHSSCAECFELNEVPFNWLDKPYTLVLDPSFAIDEIFEDNNIKTFTGSITVL